MFLKLHALTFTEDVPTTELLANSLMKIMQEKPIPAHIASSIKVVRLLLVNNLNISSDSEQSILATEKLLATNQRIAADLAPECEFIKATTIDQKKHLLKLVEMVDSMSSTLYKLKEVHKDLVSALTDIQMAPRTFSSLDEHIQSLSSSTKSLVTLSKDLCKVPTPAGHPALHIYADIAGRQTNPMLVTPTALTPPNSPTMPGPDQPDHILQVMNHLSIADKQIYVIFDPTDTKAPKAKEGSTALQLHTKHNMLLKLKPLPSPSPNIPTPTNVESRLVICTFCLTENNPMLLEFKSADAVTRFKVLNVEHCFLTTHVCPSAAIFPCSFCIILCFVPCNSSFGPYDLDHLMQIKEDMNLPPHSIVSATWIKKK